jgi:ribosomal protein S18 acetylase RimI-like enzyme
MRPRCVFCVPLTSVRKSVLAPEQPGEQRAADRGGSLDRALALQIGLRPRALAHPTRGVARLPDHGLRHGLIVGGRLERVSTIEVRRLGAAALQEHLDALAEVLRDCVDGGASVSYMAPFSQADARAAFEEFAADAELGGRMILAAFDGDDVVGTVQVVPARPPNQPHRADIVKLLVHRKARRRGVAQQLMTQAEAEALAEGKTLLVLDTVTGDAAERLYERLGFIRVGVIPNYALYPDGRLCATTFFYKDLAP